ncbi:MAG: DUF4837 family protein [Bacteroidia bacterium]
MKLVRVPLYLLCFLLLLSCADEGKKKKKELKPSATGELAEIVIIYDKSRSTEAFKEEIQEIFGQKLEGLPNPSENKFKLLFTDQTFLKGYFKLHHNVFVLLNQKNLDKMIHTYGESNRSKIEELLPKTEVLGFNKENVWSKYQNVFYVTAETQEEMLDKMNSRKSDLIELANNHELQTAQHMVLNLSVSKDSFYQEQLRLKNYSVRKPDSYRVAKETNNFCWLRKESSKYNYDLIIYDLPYTSQDQFSMQGIVADRDKITEEHIPGEVEGSYMKVDMTMEPYTEEMNFNEQYAVHTRGWWKVEGDWMGGPFVSYSIYDKKRQRVVVADGFIYGPNKEKARALREVEIILHSLKIND